MGEVTLKGYPNTKQKEFFLADARHIGYGGARGGGKSWAMRRKLVLRRLKYPGSKGLLLRRTYPELYQNHVLALLEELKGIAVYNQQNRIFTFPNDSKLVLGYCDAETDVLRYQGQEYDDIGLEEATQFTEYQMQFLKTCNRTINPDLPPRMYYTANPGGVGHSWFKRLFIDRQHEDNERPGDYVFIQARVYDNPVLMENNPEYVTHLESLPDDLRRAFLDGDWDVFAGQYFREFRRDIHTCEPFAIPHYWKRFRSIDWGYSAPCAAYWHAIGDDGRIYTYREYYQAGRIAADVAATLLKFSEGEDIAYTVASPDMWQKRGMRGAMIGESIADEFFKAGVPLTQADTDRINGWQRMREYLAVVDYLPNWLIFNNCVNLIRTIPELLHDKNRVEDVGDGEDHAAESCRYALMSRPRPAQKPEPEKKEIPWQLQTASDGLAGVGEDEEGRGAYLWS